MQKDRNSINTKVPTKDLDDYEKFLKKRKSFEDVELQKIPNISYVGNVRVNSTNYKYVSIVRRGNVFTYFARISKRVNKQNLFRWHGSFSNVVEAAKAVDTKLLENGFPSVNFKFKLKPKEIIAKGESLAA